MAPKKAKANTGEDAPPYWHAMIEEAILDEEIWKVKVFIFDAAESDVDRMYLNKFEIFSIQEKRFVVKNICKTETIFMINQLGSEKKGKDENMLIFEEAESYLRDKKEIPTEVFALIIKHLILNMKEEYLFIKRAKLEVKEGLRQESQTMLKKEEVRSTASAKRTEPPPPKLPSTKNAPVIENTPQPVEGKKYNTTLRLRGEEWRDKVYVDDFPVDGPNLYVAVSGFMDPLLAGCLIKIGVPLCAVVKISIDPSATSIPLTLNPPTKRGQSQTEIFAEKSTKFWSDIQQVRLHRETADTFVNTAFIIFSPPYWTNDQLSGNPEQIYDELSYLMYDVQDLSRQHAHYLENMEIINVPEDTESTVLNKRYHRKIDDLPLECVTLYSVINSILESVCNIADTPEHDYESSLSESVAQQSGEDVKVLKAKTLVKNVFNTLCKTDCNKTYRVTYGEEYEIRKEPIIISYGDLAKHKTFHLDRINIDPIVTSSLYFTPINNLWLQKEFPNEELGAKIDFHYNLLLSCFEREDVENSEINRLLHILACRKLFNNRSSLKKIHLKEKTIVDFKRSYLKRTKLAEPIPLINASKTSYATPSPILTNSDTVISSNSDSDSDARIKYLFECPDLTELVSAAEISIQAAIGHVIDSYEYFEDLSGVSSLQTLFDAYNSYNCVDYKYCEVTDSFILMFFNSHNNEGISHYEWRNNLATPVCLHDFFDFILEEEYEWIKKEEQIYDENMMLRSLSLLRDSMEVLPKSCLDNIDIENELLMEGSLKHQAYEKQIEEENQDEIAPSTTVLSEKTGPTTTETERTSALKSPKNRKNQKTTYIKEDVEKEESEDGLIDDPKPFVGFNISDRRVEVFGKDSTFFSKDGTKVFSSYMLFIPSNLEYVTLSVVPGTKKTEFWFHKSLGECASREALSMSECLRITTKDQISIYLKKEEFTIPIYVENEDSFNVSPKLADPLPPPGDESILFETRHFYSFIKTWPNGLITESVFVENSDKISHIKQFYIKPLPCLSEDKRCISLNGEVIIFKTDHEIEILRPDGTFILVTKIGKKRIKTEADEQLTSSRTSKFAKPSMSSKLSKKHFEDDEFIDPTAEYEMHIKEYEIIETSGLRQKWVDDESTDIEKLIIKTATDYCLGEIFTRRMDGTSYLLNKDGLLVVTFPNNTRIITSVVIEPDEIFPEWTEEEIEYLQLFDNDPAATESDAAISQKSAGTHASVHSRDENIEEETNLANKNQNEGYVSVQLIYIIEHAHFATVTVNKAQEEITIDSPDNVSLKLSTGNKYNISLDSSTSASFDGNNLEISHEACTECGSYTSCEVAVATPDEVMSLSTAKNWLTLKDSYNKKIVVTDEGTLYVDDSKTSEEIFQDDQNVDNAIIVNKNTSDEKPQDQQDAKSENSIAAHEKCENSNETKSVRFFVLRRDLTCSELLHSALVEEYKHKCRWQPWCSITEHDTFGDHRKLHSIILPINLTESEKWMMDSKLADKPKYLTYKDLKTDEGKGFYHWMRPYARFKPQPRKPNNVLPPRQPRAFVLRTLEKQWYDANKDELAGAKELITAILKYRKVLEQDSASLLTVPVRDFRTEAEATTDQVVASIGERILLEDLKRRLEEDLTATAKASITTKPPPPPAYEGIEEAVEEEWSDGYTVEQEQSTSEKELSEAVPVSAALAKYWRQREEEYKEEQLYRHLLRDGTVPPYFQNVLGGAIWWEANNLATEAVSKAERNRMKCPCYHEAEEISSASRTYRK